LNPGRLHPVYDRLGNARPEEREAPDAAQVGGVDLLGSAQALFSAPSLPTKAPTISKYRIRFDLGLNRFSPAVTIF